MNKMTLIGNLTRDPETREIRRNGTDSTVTNFTVAVNDGYGDHKRTDFVRIAAWNGLSATCAMYLKKGMKVYAEGSVTANAYLNGEGKPVGQMEMRLEHIVFLSRVFGMEDASAAVDTQAAGDDIDALL